MSESSPVIKLALEKKMVTEEQVDQCKEMLRKGKKIGFDTTLEELLIKQGFLIEEQVEELKHISTLGDGTGTLFGHYRLGRLIGEGGMGKVYEATHEFMGRTVAIKVINQEHTADKVKALRFFQEIRALIKTNHPNIVTIFDAGRVRRSYYYAMELLPGPSLKEYVDKRKFLPEKEALSIIRSIALALGHAHENSLVHRDVKPENIMFDSQRSPRLMDFGVAMHHDEHHMTLTQEGVTIGSLHYTSPEQVDGTRDIDRRSDIYSLGATLYYALSGRTVYSGDTPQALLTKHLTGNLVSPRNFNKLVSHRTVALIKKMMAVNRDRRFQSMADVVAAIDRPPLVEKLRFMAFVTLAAFGAVLLGIFLQKFLILIP
jgi:serine/threonine-protein kinase